MHQVEELYACVTQEVPITAGAQNCAVKYTKAVFLHDQASAFVCSLNRAWQKLSIPEIPSFERGSLDPQ